LERTRLKWFLIRQNGISESLSRTGFGITRVILLYLMEPLS